MFKPRVGKEGLFVKHRWEFSVKTRFSNCLVEAMVNIIRRYIKNFGWPSLFSDDLTSKIVLSRS